MRAALRRAGFVLLPAFFYCGSALAQQLPKPLSDPATSREEFLAVAIVAMMGCGFLSFLLRARVSERTLVALAMLSVLIGGFGLLVLFGGNLYESPVGAAVAIMLLIAMFKFMSMFEGRRKSDRPPPKE
jgi:peptidoglycan/LPS O-acetylase OafA/YrhL